MATSPPHGGDHPTYVERMVADGHLLLNHTWSHPSFTGYSTGKSALSPARRVEQIARLQNKVVDLTGRSTKPYFRPPYGDVDGGVLRVERWERFHLVHVGSASQDANALSCITGRLRARGFSFGTVAQVLAA